MSGEIVREWHFWLVSVAAGACMAFVYDVVRLFRRLVRHGRLAVDLEDILYWAACFGLSFTLLYYGNNGVIRLAAVLGAAVGMLAYAVTIGRFFVKISFLIIDRTAGSLLRALRRLLVPVRRALIRLFHKIRLTGAAIRHKMKVHSRRKAGDRKGKAADGKKKGKAKAKCKKTKKKDAGVSPREK